MNRSMQAKNLKVKKEDAKARKTSRYMNMAHNKPEISNPIFVKGNDSVKFQQECWKEMMDLLK